MTDTECKVDSHVPIADGSRCDCAYFYHIDNMLLFTLEHAYAHGNGLDVFQLGELLEKEGLV